MAVARHPAVATVFWGKKRMFFLRAKELSKIKYSHLWQLFMDFGLIMPVNRSNTAVFKMILQTGLVVIVSHTLFLPPRKFAFDGKHTPDCGAIFFLQATRHFFNTSHLAFKPSREMENLVQYAALSRRLLSN
ncbi:MAG: hypothetical protein RIQ78_254 [Bacteroidota bacterium]|jgi:hypothetical protein